MTYSSGGSITTVKGKPYGPSCLLFSRLGAGNHRVEVEVAYSDGYYPVYIRFFSSCIPQGRSLVMSITRAITYIGGGSDVNVQAYNTGISTTVSRLQSIGLRVSMVDITSLIKLQEDMRDDVHWSDSGHLKAAAAVLSQLQETPSTLKLSPVFYDGVYHMVMTPQGLRKLCLK